MTPSRPQWLRTLGSALATAWFVLLCAYLFPWDRLDRTRPGAVSWPVQHLGMYQSWRMFRKPGTYNRFLIHEGLTADGEVVQIQRDTRPPEGRFVVLDYGRWRKVQYTLSVDDKYLDGYADWVCRQAPDDVESIRLRVYKYKKHTPKTARTGKARKEKDAVLLERPCP